MGTADIESILVGLCSSQRLQRERQLLVIKSVTDERKRQLVDATMNKLTSDGLSWESCSGLLSAAVHLLPDFSANQLSEVTRLALNHLDHDESRVRQNSGDLLAHVAAHAASPPTLFLEIFDTLVALIKRDLSRDPTADELPENEKVRQKIIDGQKNARRRNEFERHFSRIRRVAPFGNVDDGPSQAFRAQQE